MRLVSGQEKKCAHRIANISFFKEEGVKGEGEREGIKRQTQKDHHQIYETC
jgi:hypothetical protein